MGLLPTCRLATASKLHLQTLQVGTYWAYVPVITVVL